MKRSMLKSSMAGAAMLALLGASTPVALADSGTTNTSNGTPQSWTVQVGSSTPDMSFMAMGFFPNSIVVDAGDTVTFVGSGHTIAFPGNGQMPPIGSPLMFKPTTDQTYDGTKFVSSGLLMGKPWSLTFTKPGVYPYYCGLHPGMAGVVIVQPAGTAYPMTQAQYNQIGAVEAQEDLAAAQTALTAVQVKTTPGPHGTTVYHIQTDLPELSAYQFNLAPAGPGGAMGAAKISMVKPGVWNISGQLSGLKAGQWYTPQLEWGVSDSGKAVSNAHFAKVKAAQNGTAEFSGTVHTLAVPQGVWVLDVTASGSATAVSSGTIDYPSFAYERFLPGNLTIHQGDTVVWTQMGPNEEHTISFVPKGMKVGDPTKPAGGHVYAGHGYFSSGYLAPGQSYQLTFTKPGTYTYSCLIHAMMNMTAVIHVLPKK
ncbi:hypothetical protein Alches_23340 [Alicyclobacillus hesperidum subsp. aegles]|uniref:cupredoxin domain-containing protein n=1 Tax=Alicyclobacillus hesperidum TaxID=89784 RepID=UPI00222D63A5|nr:plastocyanin/azurin family copper-binding protein [Alicyclobacillus hesperidum]GLG02293.1 hypothetical protein Alches_23340 [Alicyclobacillus hesperidum subsp. aegles]